MSLYHWQALTAAGEPRQGAMAGESEVQIVDLLRRQGLRVTMVRREQPVLELAPARATTPAVLAVLRELLALRSVGLGVPAALARLAGVRDASALGGELALVRRALEAGQPLAEALARVPQRFDDLACQVLAAGESHGALDDALRRLVAYLEGSARPTALAAGLRRVVGSVAVALLVAVLMLGLIAPAAANLYLHLGVPVPGALGACVELLPGLRWFAWVIGTIGLASAAALRTPRLRARLDALALRLPGLGPALRSHAAVRLARLLALLLAVDVPLLRALELTAPRLGNLSLGVALLHARTHAAQGVDLATALADAELLSPLGLELLRVVEAGDRRAALAALVLLCEAEADERARAVRQAARAVQAVIVVAIVAGVVMMLGPLLG